MKLVLLLMSFIANFVLMVDRHRIVYAERIITNVPTTYLIEADVFSDYKQFLYIFGMNNIHL